MATCHDLAAVEASGYGERVSYGSSDSFLWRSFLWGCELLVAGFIWRIVNAKVRELSTASVGWNVSLVRSAFASEEVDAILSLPLGSTHANDSLLWHFNKSGVYSVKSGILLGGGSVLRFGVLFVTSIRKLLCMPYKAVRT
ncbi:hypothetical protein EZV62_001203 [Acer yangbiense]|uniref:Uncharacterized protein n=1 Tax=Acer yangbiense TaxID=1000413 RepID=A0A5C7IUU4_9ROSI|nr:hypothetical protein EZV62_001203 [Acer yangbiense]